MELLIIALGAVLWGLYALRPRDRKKSIPLDEASFYGQPLGLPAPLATAIRGHGLPLDQISSVCIYDEISLERLALLRDLHAQGCLRGSRAVEVLKYSEADLAPDEVLCVVNQGDREPAAFVATLS